MKSKALQFGVEDEPLDLLLYQVYRSIPHIPTMYSGLEFEKGKAVLKLFFYTRHKERMEPKGYISSVYLQKNHSNFSLKTAYFYGDTQEVRVEPEDLIDKWVETWRVLSHEIEDVLTKTALVKRLEERIAEEHGLPSRASVHLKSNGDLGVFPFDFKNQKWDWKEGTYLRFKYMASFDDITSAEELGPYLERRFKS